MSHWHEPNIFPADESLHSDLLNSIRKNRRIRAPLKMNNPSRLAATVYLRAVHVEPPVADEVLLVEQGPVGAEEAVLDEVGVTKVGTDVECLALSFGVSIVTLQIHPMKINSHQAIYGFPPLCSRRSQNWSPGERHRWDNLHLEIQGLPQTRPQWGQPGIAKVSFLRFNIL